MNDINTYGDLKKAVQHWLNRKDDTTIKHIPLFINMALKQFTRMIKLPYYEVLVSLEAIEGYDYVNIPQDFLSAKTVSINGMPYNRLDVATFQRLNNTDVATGGSLSDGLEYGRSAGHWFTRIGGQLKFYPELQAGDIVEMVYQRDIPELRDDNEEPYCILIASDAMLYLSLRHASIFLRDFEAEQQWMAKAQDSVMSLQAQLDEAEWSGSTLVVPMFEV